MSWSLAIENGDFSLNQASIGIVTAQDKLIQDLSHWCLEKMGTDLFHPGYGALFDGGRLPNGTMVRSTIGSVFRQSEIEAEVRRIVSEYQAAQLNRAKGDRQHYSKTTLTPGEILLNLENVELFQIEDNLLVTLSIKTASGAHLTADMVLLGA